MLPRNSDKRKRLSVEVAARVLPVLEDAHSDHADEAHDGGSKDECVNGLLHGVLSVVSGWSETGGELVDDPVSAGGSSSSIGVVNTEMLANRQTAPSAMKVTNVAMRVGRCSENKNVAMPEDRNTRAARNKPMPSSLAVMAGLITSATRVSISGTLSSGWDYWQKVSCELRSFLTLSNFGGGRWHEMLMERDIPEHS